MINEVGSEFKERIVAFARGVERVSSFVRLFAVLEVGWQFVNSWSQGGSIILVKPFNCRAKELEWKRCSLKLDCTDVAIVLSRSGLWCFIVRLHSNLCFEVLICFEVEAVEVGSHCIRDKSRRGVVFVVRFAPFCRRIFTRPHIWFDICTEPFDVILTP